LNIERDGTLSGHRIGLRDFIESLLHLIRPLARNRLLRTQLDDNSRRGFRIVPLLRKMNVIFSEAGAALAPPPGESDADGIKDRSFPSVIWADENRSLSKVKIERLYRAEVFDVQRCDSHC
jgi:hypothetical protein